MDNASTRYVQRQLSAGRGLMLRKTRDDAGNRFPRRTMSVLIHKYVRDFLSAPGKSKRWVVMPGLRGVGKTTIVAQAYLSVEQSLGDRVNLLYVSLDEAVEKLNTDLSGVLEAYESVLGMTLENLDKPTFILIDEVQADPKWARTLKFVYDRTDRVFLLCTGSSATHLQMDADIAGRRAQIEKLHPLSYPEYQVLAKGIFPRKGLKDELIEALYYSPDAPTAFAKLKDLEAPVNQQWAKYDRKDIGAYIKTGTMPFTLHSDEPGTYATLAAAVDKVITSDLQSLRHFGADSITAMKRLLFILADSGDIVSLDNMAKWVKTSHTQLLSMFDALIKAELLIKIPAYGNNATATRNPAKYRFMSPAIRAAHHDIVGDPSTLATRRGMLLEDIGALHFYREFVTKNRGALTYYYERAGGHCDFIVKIGNTHQLAIEVGMGRKEPAQLEKTLSRVGCRYGLAFSEAPLGLHEDKSVLIVPHDFFFLV